MQSGTYNVDALEKECPEGYVKVCEGSTAVLFPPAMVKNQNKSTTEEDSDVTSGSALYMAQDEEHNGGDDNQAVFYNPAQVVNRDLSICAIELFSRLRRCEPKRKGGTTEGITILEALSATGLRAIRYFKEITNVKYVIANDMDADAVRCIGHNCAFNGVPITEPTLRANFDLPSGASPEDEGNEEKMVKGAVIPNLDDAVDLMHRLAINPGVHTNQRLAIVQEGSSPSSGEEKVTTATTTPAPVLKALLQQELMDVVDLDPYGSASPFLDGAFRCIKEGGLMLVTSTDSAVLCGNHMDTCHAKYNAIPYKGGHCHDMAVRILLSTIERAANKHKKYIVPIISLHIDFYVRCFFRVYTQPAEVKLSPCKLGYQMQCTHCPAFWVRPMAVERPSRPQRERKKRGRDASHQNDRKEGDNQTQSGTCTSTGKTQAGPPQSTSNAAPPTVPFEKFPTPPSRQTNPKLACPSLASMQCAWGGGEETEGSTSTAESPSSPSTGNSCCPVCGSAVTVSGPIYCGSTQNREFLTELLKVIDERHAEKKITATARIKGLVQVALEELPECPLFYNLPDIASYVKVRCPQTPCFVGALGRMGYRCSQVHCAPSGFKTDCPPSVLFAVMLQWKQLQDEEDRSNGVACATSDIKLRVKPASNADFSYDKQYDFRRDGTGIAKFIPNAPGWGPKRRHTGAADE